MLFANIDPVAVAFELRRQRLDEFPIRIKNENRTRLALMRNVEATVLVDADAVGGVAVMMTSGKVTPVVMTFVTILALADDRLVIAGAFRQQQSRCG